MLVIEHTKKRKTLSDDNMENNNLSRLIMCRLQSASQLNPRPSIMNGKANK